MATPPAPRLPLPRSSRRLPATVLCVTLAFITPNTVSPITRATRPAIILTGSRSLALPTSIAAVGPACESSQVWQLPQNNTRGKPALPRDRGPRRRRFGDFGERVAASHLEAKGY